MTSSIRLSITIALMLGGCAVDTTSPVGDAVPAARDAGVVIPPDTSTPTHGGRVG